MKKYKTGGGKMDTGTAGVQHRHQRRIRVGGGNIVVIIVFVCLCPCCLVFVGLWIVCNEVTCYYMQLHGKVMLPSPRAQSHKMLCPKP